MYSYYAQPQGRSRALRRAVQLLYRRRAVDLARFVGSARAPEVPHLCISPVHRPQREQQEQRKREWRPAWLQRAKRRAWRQKARRLARGAEGRSATEARRCGRRPTAEAEHWWGPETGVVATSAFAGLGRAGRVYTSEKTQGGRNRNHVPHRGRTLRHLSHVLVHLIVVSHSNISSSPDATLRAWRSIGSRKTARVTPPA